MFRIKTRRSNTTRCLFVAKLMALALLLVACEKHESVMPPDIKINPNAKERYEIVVTVEDAPETLKRFAGKVQYTIQNRRECLPVDYTRSLGGSRHNYDKSIEVMFEATEAGVYKSFFFMDAVLDENYYGLDVCHWSATVIAGKLDIADSKLSRLGVGINELLSQPFPVERYCLRSEHIEDYVEVICRGLRPAQSDTEPMNWYYKVTIVARRK